MNVSILRLLVLGCSYTALTTSLNVLAYSTQQHPRLQKPQTALVWLRTSLRVNDNLALTCGADMGPDGLTILYTWSQGKIPQTPAAVFECAAARALEKSLQEKQQRLSVLHTNGDTIHQVANAVKELQPSAIIVDTHEHPEDAKKLQTMFPHLNIIQLKDENTLLHPFSKTTAVLGRSRQGGKILRWATILSNMQNESVILPLNKIQSLPVAVSISNTLPLPEPTAAGNWAKALLQSWGEVSETEALIRAEASATKIDCELGNAGKIPIESRLSPYIRWGMISPRQASKIGIRQRDLLWRDWSHLCYYSLLNPLRRGEPVVKLLDRCYSLEEEENYDQQHLKFSSWCVGNTGSPLVDAGMRQLWLEGWMPRHIRLLCAACLVEGLNIDWRKGRDWFEHTLIDHDPAINEMMWQNAGFCGVDPFYSGLKWEEPLKHYSEYTDHYIKQSLHLPSELRKYANQDAPHEWVELASTRRDAFRKNGVYKAATRVANSGIRVAWPGINQGDVVADGEVIGVGRTLINELAFNIRRNM